MDSHAAAMLQALRSAGVKLTQQRRAVVERFASDPTHPTAQGLFIELRALHPGMSFATVYNTLACLRAQGLCRDIEFAGAATRFDPNSGRHDHSVCERCGAVRDIPALPVARRRLRAGARLVAARARRPRRGIRSSRRLARARGRPARAAPMGQTAGRVGARHRPQSELPAAAALPVAAHGARAGRARGPTGLGRRRACALRRPDRRQTSLATRSSTRLKTNAPSASAATAETAR